MELIVGDEKRRGYVEELGVQIEEHLLSGSSSTGLPAEATTIQRFVLGV